MKKEIKKLSKNEQKAIVGGYCKTYDGLVGVMRKCNGTSVCVVGGECN